MVVVVVLIMTIKLPWNFSKSHTYIMIVAAVANPVSNFEEMLMCLITND